MTESRQSTLQSSCTASNRVTRTPKGISLRQLLVVPFLLQVGGAVTLVGWLSLRNGQQAVNDLAQQLIQKNNHLVAKHLTTYLGTPHQINQLNADALRLGELRLTDLEQAGLHFWKQTQVFDDVSYIGGALPTGEFAGAGRWIKGQGTTIDERSARLGYRTYAYRTDHQGKRTQPVLMYEYNPKEEPWYPAAIQAGKPIWSSVFNWSDTPEYIAIDAGYPVYDDQHRLMAVLDVSLLLSNISQFLRQLAVSPSAQVFIVERDGNLIASSSPEQPFIMVQGKAERLSIDQSRDPLMRATGQYLQQTLGTFYHIKDARLFELAFQKKRYFVQVSPWQDPYGLDWLVVITVPESDFMVQIDANTRMTIWLCLAALIGTAILGMLTSRWVIGPILQLIRASGAIANGNLAQQLPSTPIHELGQLSQTFNRMADQLAQSFAELENRVEERTASLKQTQTHLEQAKEAAEAANRAKSQFLASMSHELRTPLNAILGFTQLMERDTALQTEHQEYVQIINHSGEHLLGLINDVLDMSKIESGQLILTPNAFDLHNLLDTVGKLFSLKAQAKGLELLVYYTNDVPPYVHTDESKLRQVLINLLGNAVKFTNQGHITLRVGLEPDGGATPQTCCLQFEVKDTGMGMATNELEQLFQPFVQTASGRQIQQGTGLGLSICRKFVQAMGSDIQVCSVPGQGTCFQFAIQVQLADRQDLPQDHNHQRVIALAPNQPTYRLLVVDDVTENRLLLIKLLVPLGFEVREADNGQRAIAIWQEWSPHLIWMDMQMPIMDGYTATQTIKQTPRGLETVIIALTASALDTERDAILAIGCDDFVHKPFRAATLFAKLTQHLGVEFIYGNPSDMVVSAESTCSLTADAITMVMPPHWIADLQTAASCGDDERIYALLAEIPPTEMTLMEGLLDLTRQFAFEQITNLTQPLNNELPLSLEEDAQHKKRLEGAVQCPTLP